MRVINTEDGRKILLPSNDYIFKLIFADERNKRILAAFLAAVLQVPKDELADLTIMNTELLPEAGDDKLGIMDILVRMKTGETINIEIQIVKSAAFFERISFYKSKLTVAQISAHESYDRIKKTICIVITDFNLIENSMPNRYHHIYRLYDPVDGTYFGDVEEVHTFELPRLPKTPDGTVLWEWVSFIKAKEEKELRMVKERNAEVGLAVDELYRVSADEKIRYQYEMREKAWRDEYARISYGRQEGREEGRRDGIAEGLEKGIAEGLEKGLEKGRAEGFFESARRMKAHGVRAEDIAAFTGLSLTQIAGL
jgi:predicted transposase/invertase (TIGR01784 family)